MLCSASKCTNYFVLCNFHEESTPETFQPERARKDKICGDLLSLNFTFILSNTVTNICVTFSFQVSKHMLLNSVLILSLARVSSDGLFMSQDQS